MRKSTVGLALAGLTSCGGGGSSSTDMHLQTLPTLIMAFVDTQNHKQVISGDLEIRQTRREPLLLNGPATLTVSLGSQDIVEQTITSLPTTISIPESSLNTALVDRLLVKLESEQFINVQQAVRFFDASGEIEVQGPGGNAKQAWLYGIERPSLRVTRRGNHCYLNNGIVAVIDMQNTTDPQSSPMAANRIDDDTYQPYNFDCSASTYHAQKSISDSGGIWTYSALNDALYYGTIVHNMFVHYLGEPPLDHQIRLRVHYGPRSSVRAFWDGAYANFSDAYPFQYSTASLDIIAHEVAHGVLLRLSSMSYTTPLGLDAQTLSEAFSDLSGVMAKHWLDPTTNLWWHGEETDGSIRKLNQIQTESAAVSSYLDYATAGNNPYLRIGLITYPFYLLSQKWGVESTYQVYIDATRCWTAESTLIDGARCIVSSAGQLGYPTSDVYEAFDAVNMPLL
ncbi:MULTISPECIES: M4 family metallopeptidase [Vibrio]|uniref:M4 family metallopeptidase n=2 Tax=Vibrionaceae TaxID=641 RepID=UPI0001B957FA|nr:MULTISPECIES: M4 family metallopeptidase [Vibrio]EEX34306.1 zinc metalloprotease (elastase) [Vibrio coralliilyticus ATCC BAA-450]MDE3898349.1 M4 family metallopeptidase [Vibrio sp. CC007]